MALSLPAPSPGMLLARIPLQVVDVSSSGCLLESLRPIEPGRVATLRLTVNGVWYVEDVRVTRCQEIDGQAGVYRIGAEFLRTRRLQDRTLGEALVEMNGGAVRRGAPID